MPLYSYKCPEHGEVDRRLTIAESGTEQRCGCGQLLTRLITVPSFRIVKDGRDTVLETLNREHTGAPTRETMLMAKGLEEPKPPVIGIGIGG